MRRIFVLAGLFVAIALPSPVSAHEATRRCVVSVDPGRGGPHDTFRITGRHFPLEKNGGSLEVQIEVSRVVFTDVGTGLEGKQIFILSLIPGVHRFYVDINQQIEGQNTGLKPGHYVVAAQTSHQKGCRTAAGFDVVRGLSATG